MKIIADENMPMVRELFADFGLVETFPGRELSFEQVKDADALLVRSVTPVNAALLDGSSIGFVGSATIGTDHVDLDYLEQQGIQFANAPGCNAGAVVQYVLSVLFSLRADWMSQTVGIVGCGSVGGRLYQTLQKLGVNCRCYDPFLECSNLYSASNLPLVSFDEVIQSDILCLHTPLTVDGPYPTFHLFNEDVLSRLGDNVLLINAGRGAVVDNRELLRLLPHRSWQVALDVWEGEPNIMIPLLERVDIGTPHIAGYSYDGKVNGTTMVRDAFCRWQGIVDSGYVSGQEASRTLRASTLSEAVLATFEVLDEDRRMRELLLTASVDVSPGFDQLRKSCPKRLEFHHYQITGDIDNRLALSLRALDFKD
jgi:erythronate-4-phosphate dehydrogenase